MAETSVMTALRTGTEDRQTDQQIAMALQALSLRQKQEAGREQEQAQQQRLQGAKYVADRAMASPPPQAMAPGQPSVPMQPPQQGGVPPPPMGGSMMAQPQPQQPPPVPPQQPMPWMTGKTAPPSLGGQPPPPAASGQLSSPPAAPNTGIDMPKIRDPKEIFKTIDTTPELANLPLDEKGRLADAMAETMSKQNKAVVEQWKIGQEVKEAQAKAGKQAEEAALTKLFHGIPPTPEMKKLYFVTGDIDKAMALGRQQEQKKAIPPKYAGGGAGSGGGTASQSTGFDAKYEKMSPIDKETLDEQAWANIKTGAVPYRKGSGGGNDKNALMYANKARIAMSLGMSAEELASKPAEFKATAQSLNQVTKDLSAIEPFKDMLDTNADIAKNLAKKAIATNSQFANKTINWLRQNATDNPDVAEYLAQIRIVQTEAARVLNNPRLVGQLTDSARHEMEGVVNGDMPLEATTRVIDRLKADGTNRVAAMQKKENQLRGQLEGKSQTEPKASGPKSGDVENGYRFKGGDPAKKENWEKV